LTPHGNRYWVISNTDTSGYFGIRQNISLRLLANTTYTLSYWIMPTENNVGQALVSIQYKDANKNNIYHTHYYKNSSLILNKWNKLTYTFTTKENMDRSYVTCALSTQTTAWHGNFGDFKLELGSHSTDWSPSPDDEPLWANPVGSVRISATADNPSTTIGGVWEQTCQGRKPVGVGTGTDINGLSKTFTLGEKGGEYKHSQTEEEGFKHRHMQNVIAEGNSFGWDGKDHIRKDYGGDLKQLVLILNM
ncbi:carbohydrate binding domain-containing protein, partial [uncultured Clostridium sp.]|uniref:phage baseplate protein n=1 Tax=uncultured Clostridium sp. TaxID=59620 RepID=UPI0025F8C934